MPKSTTSVPGGSARRARRSASATPKPSSPRNTFPIPASRILDARGSAPGASSMGSTSAGEKKNRWPSCRSRPRSRPGSSSATTASETLPSMSCSIASIIAVLPASARSKTSPLPPGRRRTRLPARSCTPATSTLSGPGRSRNSHSLRIASALQPELADGAVEPHQLLWGERLGPLEDLAGARIGGPHLGLLLVGQAEDVEDQELVDLAAVEQVSGALGGDARVVLEDDWRAEHRRPRIRLAHEDRPCSLVAAGLRRGAQIRRGVGERHKVAVARVRQHVG